MEQMKDISAQIKSKLTGIVLDDAKFSALMRIVLFSVLAIVGLFMSVVNLFTNEIPLMCSTLAFFVLFALNVILTIKNCNPNIVSYLIMIEVIILFGYFIISGNPQGFSVLWMILVPMLALLLLGTKEGLILSTILFIMILFFFRTDTGLGILKFEYNETFRLRFPMLYLASFVISVMVKAMITTSQKAYISLTDHDILTGALSRNGFTKIVSRLSESVKGKPVGFIIFDIDLFKKVNDTYGHDSGDIVLVEMSKIVSSLTDDPFCRWGGEEFVVFLTDGESTKNLAEAIRTVVASHVFHVNEVNLHLSVSVGAVVHSFEGDVDIYDLCKHADKCLYHSKESGRNQTTFMMY